MRYGQETKPKITAWLTDEYNLSIIFNSVASFSMVKENSYKPRSDAAKQYTTFFYTFPCNNQNYHLEVRGWHCCTRPKADANSA